jgi:hypothetical protein
VNFGSQMKLVKNQDSSNNDLSKCHVPFDEVFETIQENHLSIGHCGIWNILKEIKKRFANITENQVKLFISGCDECKLKRSKPKNSTSCSTCNHN